jgi:hypothetical protein
MDDRVVGIRPRAKDGRILHQRLLTPTLDLTDR